MFFSFQVLEKYPKKLSKLSYSGYCFAQGIYFSLFSLESRTQIKQQKKDFFLFFLQMFLDKQTTKCLVVPQLILADTALIIYSLVFLQLSFNLTVIVKYDGAIPAEIELNKDVPWLHVFTLALSVSGDVLLPGIYNGRNHFTM